MAQHTEFSTPSRSATGHDHCRGTADQGSGAREQGAAPCKRHIAHSQRFFRPSGARPQAEVLNAYIDQHRDTYGVEPICKVLQVAPSAYRRHAARQRNPELAQHAQLRIDAGLAIYFCDPRSPWQRGTNENTNGLLRQYFPKGTDISRYTDQELDAVAATLNNRPRKTLAWKTPAEALDELLSSEH